MGWFFLCVNFVVMDWENQLKLSKIYEINEIVYQIKKEILKNL